MARKKSSYRLGRRLKSSAKARLDYITYLQAGGNPAHGKITPAERGRLGVRFALGGAMRTGFSSFEPQHISAVYGLGGEVAIGVAIPQVIGAAFEGGGNFRMNIFPPVTLVATWELGGEITTNLKVSKAVQASFDLGGAMRARVPRVKTLRTRFALGGEMALDIAEIMQVFIQSAFNLGGEMTTNLAQPIIELGAVFAGGGAMTADVDIPGHPFAVANTTAASSSSLSFNSPSQGRVGDIEVLFTATYGSAHVKPASGWTELMTLEIGGTTTVGRGWVGYRVKSSAGAQAISVPDGGSRNSAICMTVRNINTIQGLNTIRTEETAATSITPINTITGMQVDDFIIVPAMCANLLSSPVFNDTGDALVDDQIVNSISNSVVSQVLSVGRKRTSANLNTTTLSTNFGASRTERRTGVIRGRG